MTFAEFVCPHTLGASLSQHPLSPPESKSRLRRFAAGVARVNFGDPTAKKWPEALATVGGHAFLLSERIVEQLMTLAPCGVEFYPIEIVRIASYHLEKIKPPTYLWTRITGEMPARILQNGTELRSDSSSGMVELKPIDYLQSKITIQFDPNEWDGSDFFALSTLGHGMRFCSERIIEAGAKFRWKNIVFARADAQHSLRIS